jgi:hypothetical protein
MQNTVGMIFLVDASLYKKQHKIQTLLELSLPLSLSLSFIAITLAAAEKQI